MEDRLADNIFFKKQKKFWESPEVKKRRTPVHPVIKAFAEPKISCILQELKKAGEIPSEMTIADVGCGNGFLSYYLEKEFKELVCSDFSQSILDVNPCANKICANVENLPFADQSFDIVFSSNILHHLSDPIVAIREMKRVAKKYVIISDVNRSNLIFSVYGFLKKEERGINRLPADYIERYFAELGMEIISRKDLGLILPNITKEFMLPFLKAAETSRLITPFYSMAIAKVSDENENK